MRIWNHLQEYDSQRGSLRTWIYCITRNQCCTMLEGSRESVDFPWTEQIIEDSAAGAGDPQIHHAQVRDLHLLRKLVYQLPHRYRRVVLLYYFEERSVSDVGEMLGMPDGTVKTHLHRARAALSELLRLSGLHDRTLWLETSS